MLYCDCCPKIKISKQTKTENASPFGAFSVCELISINLRAKRADGVFKINIIFNNQSIPMQLDFQDYQNETYSFWVKNVQPGLYFYYFEIFIGNSVFYTSSINNYDFELIHNPSSVKPFELVLYSDDFKTPKTFYGKTMYHIFVDRFYKSSKPVPLRDDAILINDFENGIPEFASQKGGEVKNNTFFGGTLYGICEKLDYLCELGVDIIYLSPIFKAFSNHKYDTGDYLTIDEMFGGKQALEQLLEQARQRNIMVVFDGVFNHTGDDSVYFNKYGKYQSLGAYQSKESPYYKWYTFNNFPNDYECWWGIDILPRLNLENTETADFFTGKDGVLQKYIKMGFSGVRLDVADELCDSFLEKLRKAVKEANPESIIIGEVWEYASNKVAYGKLRKYFQGRQLDSVMNYPLKDAIIDYVKSGNCDIIYNCVTRLYYSYPTMVSNCLMNILGTHDTIRILCALSDQNTDMPPTQASVFRVSDAQLQLAKKRLKCGAVLQFTLPGIPCIYYGDEIGMQGLFDPFCRLPFKWHDIDNELLSFYKTLGRIRKENSAFKDSPIKILKHKNGIFAFTRGNITVVVNMSQSRYTLNNGKKNQNLFTGKTEAISVASQEAAIYKCGI